MHAPFALAVMVLPDGLVIKFNNRYREIYGLEIGKTLEFDSLSLMDEESRAEARLQYKRLAEEPNQLVAYWRTYIDRSGRVFRGFVRGHTYNDAQSGKKLMLGAILDVDRSFQIAEDLIVKREDDARTGIAKVVANDLNNAMANLLSTLEIQYGDSVSIPEGIRSALNSVMQVSRKLLILGWSGERPADSPVLRDLVDKVAGFRSSLGPDDTQEHDLQADLREQLHMLVIDDDENLLKTLAEGLKIKGVNSVVAHSGEQAFAAANQYVFTHALVDLRVGEESGFVIAKTLKSVLPDLKVIYMTGYTTLNQVKSKVHSEPILMKPFRFDDLFSHINKGNTTK